MGRRKVYPWDDLKEHGTFTIRIPQDQNPRTVTNTIRTGAKRFEFDVGISYKKVGDEGWDIVVKVNE